MKNHKFKNINLIISDSGSRVRQGLKAVFFDHGFLNTRDTSRMSVVGDAVDNDAVDLIIAENEQKKERHAYQVGYLGDNILPLYGAGGADEGVIEHLERPLFVSE